MNKLSRVFTLLPALLFLGLHAPPTRAQFTLNKGDRISIIGNNLADRMQHDGWIETFIQLRFPQHELVFRHLGFTGDEVNNRPRSDGFGSPDEWLKETKADVVFACFGYNESFAGEAGLAKFRKELENFIDHTLSQNYSGRGKARLVLIGPIAHENLNSPHLPDGRENNARLTLYSKAMAGIAKAKAVPFVDLFTVTQAAYAKGGKPLTMNGVHLNSDGNRIAAQAIDAALFGASPAHQAAQMEKLRQAVIDKNFHWFSRYRTVDAYNVFGGRSRLAWHGQSNADVMQREMQIFDAMAANRDKRVHAIAKGGDLTVDDSNTPPLLDVKTNRPGPLEGGKHPFLGGEEAIGKMKVAQGMKVNLFASEERFPDLVNPVQMAVDTDGRLWVATWPTYPHWNPKEPLRDKLVILPDDDRDGKADRMIVFADGLNSVTGFEFWGGGVLVAAAPEILFLKDTDGDDKADVKIRMLQGISAEDTHHTANALTIGPDGGLYFSHGIFHVDNHETPTRTYRSTNSGVYRFDPRTYEIDFHFPIGPNPHGIAFDRHGYQFATDGTGGTGNYIAIGKGVGAPKQWYQKRVRPVPAIGFLSSSHFPAENEGNFLICNAIGFLGVLQHQVKYNGADITAHEIEPIVVSSDPNFRPTDLEVAGDGALYISDWCNPLIGHMQHNIRDPNRDHDHGRIYRVTYEGRSLLEPVKLKGKPIADVLRAFHAKENGTRYRARLELSGRETKAVTEAAMVFASAIDPASGKADDEQALLECLWVFQEHRVANGPLLAKVFLAKEPRVRAAAIRTLGHWGDKVAQWESLLLAAARDESALVRAEAAVAAPSFKGLAAAEAIFEIATRPTDVQLDFNLNYAKGRLNVDAIVQDALASNKPLSKAARTYAVQKASVATLLKMPRDEAVNLALLSRGGVPKEARLEALAAIAKTSGTTATAELFAAIKREEAAPQGAMADLLALLTSTEPKQLRDAGNDLVALASKTTSPQVRQAAYVAWITADGSGDAAWQHAQQSKDTLGDLLAAYPAIKLDAARQSLYPKIRALVINPPDHLKPAAATTSVGGGAMSVKVFNRPRKSADPGAYANVKPDKQAQARTISFDGVPIADRDSFALIFEGSIEIPRTGKYTFHLGSDDGSRLFIDGKEVIDHDGLHGMSEKSGQVSLVAGRHALVVGYFNNSGGHGLSLAWEGPGVSRQEVPAGALSGGGGGSLYDLAIGAMAATSGQDAEKIDDFAMLVAQKRHVAPALEALAGLPRQAVRQRLETKAIDPVMAALIEHADKATPVERDTAAYARLLDLGDDLVDKASDRGPLRRKLIELRASIPVKADPQVMALGREVYLRDSHCGTCHQANGKGMPNLYPPLDDSPWVTGSEQRLIRMALYGMHGTITVKGQTYKSPPLPPMTGFHSILDDKEIAAVLTFVRNSWSNRARPIDAQTVAQVRSATKNQTDAWDAFALLKEFPMEDGSTPASPPDTAGGWTPKFVKAWKLDDFANDLKAAPAGRSFEQGKLAFSRLGCVQCHKIKGEGGALGPDLTEVFKKLKNDRRELLVQMLEPSKVIDDQYKAYDIETAEGDRLFGLILSRGKDHVMIVTNPQNPTPQKIAAKDILSQRESKTSLMPQGLLHLLERGQVLDLLAYLEAGGDPKHAAFGK